MNIILIVTFFAAFIFIVERIAGALRLPNVPNWWVGVAMFNGLQAGAALLATFTWDLWMADHHSELLSGFGLWSRVFIGYGVITFFYYWWHRARHQIPLLWRWCHQVHHSPARLEVVMSFYKHPICLPGSWA